MANINEQLTKVTKDFTTMQKDFSAIKKVTIPTIEKLMQTSKNFNRVTLKFEKSLDRGDYNAKKMLEPMLIDISIVSQQMTDMAVELKASPSDIFFNSRKSSGGPGE